MKIAILLLNAGRGSGEVARQHAEYLCTSGHDVVYMHPGTREGAEGATNVDIALNT